MDVTSLKLVAAGERSFVRMFAMMGAQACRVASPEELKSLVEEIEGAPQRYGALLLSSKLADGSERYVSRIRKAGIPVVFLPSLTGGAQAGYRALEQLSERALGMKLPLG